MASKVNKKDAVFNSAVGIRRPAYREAADEEVVKTISVETVKNITVESTISINDLRSRIAAELKRKDIDSDYKKGKVYFAQAVKNLKVMAVKDENELLNILRKGTNGSTVHMTIAAAPSVTVEDEEYSNTQNSSEYREPPFVEVVKVGVSARTNREVQQKIRDFAEALFFNASSPYRHGFTLYHFGQIQATIKNKMDNKEAALMTNIAANEYPGIGDWNKFAPDGTWDTPEHKRVAMNVVLSPGKFLPKGGVIPSADACRKQLDREQEGDAGAQPAAAPAAGQVDLPQIMASIAASNSLMMQQVVAKAQPPPVPVAAVELVTKKRKVELKLERCLRRRKDLVDAGYDALHSGIKDIDEKSKTYCAQLKVIEDAEDAAEESE